jgi:hypothetical protein
MRVYFPSRETVEIVFKDAVSSSDKKHQMAGTKKNYEKLNKDILWDDVLT